MTSFAKAPSSAPASAEEVAGRYELRELLGRGGMAAVHRALDRSSGRDVALKLLTVAADSAQRASAVALFEREFHTLRQLRHPRVISVYDYGLCADGSPYYTMELLDGGDLRERAPLDWRHACQLIFDVCSALALLHSRRLLHRDLSPRNIRCTLDDKAKLIDFGALAPMSAGGTEVVGTPAFTAPETLQRLALDGRTDLYSLGVTLYYTLTARLPYSARTFSELPAAWRTKPVAPSAWVADIPAALDDLVLALIGVEPALRPASAFEVMQRLAACAGLQTEESEAVSAAYLSTPALVGRDELLAQLRQKMRSARLTRGGGVLIDGPSGAGRSRLLDACALEAQARGFTVLRAVASGSREAFTTARALASHLLDALPIGDAASQFPELFESQAEAPANHNSNTDALAVEARPRLRNLSDSALEPAQLQRALGRWIQHVSRTHPLVVAVDDVHRIDPPSAAVLADLLDKSKRGGLLLALTADSEASADDALAALSRRCSRLHVDPLTHEQTLELLGSLFGEVANLDMLAGEIHRVAHGNPRQTMELAQHLVDRGVIRYAGGSWTLPSQLSSDDLPATTAAALAARIARLSTHARWLGEAHALAYFDTLTEADYRALLPDVSPLVVDQALSELLCSQAIFRDGTVYVLSNRVWAGAFIAQLDPERARSRHRVLATLYGERFSAAFTHHTFAAGDLQHGVAALRQRSQALETRRMELRELVEQNIGRMMWCYPVAIEAALGAGATPRDIHELRRWQYSGSLTVETPPDLASSRLWFAQLAHDSGLALYWQDQDTAEPMPRLMRALQTVQQRYLETPESERVYSVEEAIRKLGEYVVVSIGVGSRIQDAGLVRSLPAMIEPFAALSPVLDAIWHNAIACRFTTCECRYERARDEWLLALSRLEPMSSADGHYIEAMKNAIAYAIGMVETQIGLASAATWADRLDSDPYQRVSALSLRKIVRLEQGDTTGADRLRRQAEVLSLQSCIPQMFKSLLTIELAAYTKGRDLAGITQVIEQMKPMAAHYPGWAANLSVAQASFHFTRGDNETAAMLFAESIQLTQPDANGHTQNLNAWVSAQAGLAECYLAMGREAEARTCAAHALSFCDSLQLLSHSADLVRTLALAEAKLGEPGAAARLDALIAAQNQLGVTGLWMGLSYEARARIALWTRDQEQFERYSELTAREYRYGARTSLGARYERLMNEAARGGFRPKFSLAEFEALTGFESSTLGSDYLLTMVSRSMAGNPSADERTQMALQMICAAHGVRTGYLYLVTPAGLVLRASQGKSTPAPELAQFVTEFMAHEQRRSEELEDMATGELLDSQPLNAVFQSGGAGYELLPLSCIVDAANILAGVAVLAADEARTRNDNQSQLLSVLAAALMESGDSYGLRMMTQQ